MAEFKDVTVKDAKGKLLFSDTLIHQYTTVKKN